MSEKLPDDIMDFDELRGLNNDIKCNTQFKIYWCGTFT
jgi:hypothetical protein